MAIPITSTQAQDADAAYVLNKLASADAAEAQAHTCTAQCKQDRLDAAMRLIEVKARITGAAPESGVSGAAQSTNNGWQVWLRNNGIPETTARRLIDQVLVTEEQREERKAKDRARKNAANAAKRAAKKESANSILKDIGVPEGGARVAIQNKVAEEVGFRKVETPEQAEQFRAVAAEVVAAKNTTLVDTRSEIAELPETARQRLARLEATLARQLEAEFDERVRKAADKMLPARVLMYKEREAEALVELKKWQTLRNGIKAQLTEADYRFLRQTIAPDRYPEEYRAKLTRAAQIINQFDTYVEAFKQ